jgi:hypothetical protein
MFPAEAALGRALTAMSLVASHINEVKRQHEDQLQLQGKKTCNSRTSVSENTAHGRLTAAPRPINRLFRGKEKTDKSLSIFQLRSKTTSKRCPLFSHKSGLGNLSLKNWLTDRFSGLKSRQVTGQRFSGPN